MERVLREAQIDQRLADLEAKVVELEAKIADGSNRKTVSGSQPVGKQLTEDQK